MLERIALHQTRLRTPGLGLDAQGVALGAKGLVLLSTIDKLVGWLAVYTRERSLEDLLPSLEIRFVRTKLGTREIVLTMAAESSDRMDQVAGTARLVGGYTFTGTARHFVQYRDAAAPFGYDTAELLASEAPLALYHDRFSQTYEHDKSIDLRSLLLRLSPQADPRTLKGAGPRVLVAEEGLGPALVHYLVRSQVDAELTLGEWPPESSFEDAGVRRYLFRVPDLPARMWTLMQTTPGITTFLPSGPGVAVEAGFVYPVELRACPVFDPTGLVLVRGRGDGPWILEKLPPMGDVRSFAKVELLADRSLASRTATKTQGPGLVRVPLRLVPSSAPWRKITATWVNADKVPLLRRLAYALPRQTLAGARVAMTDRGAFLHAATGIESIPLGTFFIEVHPGLFTPAGFDVVPAVAPEVLFRALGAPVGQAIFVTHDDGALGIPDGAFAPLEAMLLEAKPWEPLVAEALDVALAEEPVELTLERVGLFPLGTSKAETRDAR